MNWTPERIEIWNNMSPEDRDYDRIMTGTFPPGGGRIESEKWRDYLYSLTEDEYESRMDQHSCSCHTSAPCSHCTNCEKCNCVVCDDWHDYRSGERCPKGPACVNVVETNEN